MVETMEKDWQDIPLSDINITETQTRAEVRSSMVDELAAMLEGGAELDPGTVIDDGQKLYLACGHHRYQAHKKAGKTEMRCEVRPGEVWDAIELRIKDNQQHKGAMLTRADKRAAVSAVLKHRPELTDRAIAELCGVTNKTVGSVRESLESTEEIPQLDVRVGQDGRSRNTARARNGKAVVKSKSPNGEARAQEEGDAGSQCKAAGQGFSSPQSKPDGEGKQPDAPRGFNNATAPSAPTNPQKADPSGMFHNAYEHFARGVRLIDDLHRAWPHQKLHYQALTSVQNVMGFLKDWEEKAKEGDQGWGP